MKKYFSFFRLRLNTGLQYRMAAFVAAATQFLWGFMKCLAFLAFYETDPSSFPMDFQASVSYIWLQQAFFAMFTVWHTDNDIFDMIVDGGISYEMCRPVSIYHMWFARNMADRIAEAGLRFAPILLLACLLPAPFKLGAPAGPETFLLFVVTMFLGLCVTVAFTMWVYILAFFTISPQGLRMVFTALVEFLSGAIIPLPFLPEGIRKFLEFLPFAGMFNVPLRAYSRDLSGMELIRGMELQVFWIVVLAGSGMLLCRLAERKVVVQGG